MSLSFISDLSLSQLNLLAQSDIWKNQPTVWTAIFDRYSDLIQQDDAPFQNQFGTPEFWDVAFGVEEPSTSQEPTTVSFCFGKTPLIHSIFSLPPLRNRLQLSQASNRHPQPVDNPAL